MFCVQGVLRLWKFQLQTIANIVEDLSKGHNQGVPCALEDLIELSVTKSIKNYNSIVFYLLYIKSYY
jgi:hypothetical protein